MQSILRLWFNCFQVLEQYHSQNTLGWLFNIVSSWKVQNQCHPGKSDLWLTNHTYKENHILAMVLGVGKILWRLQAWRGYIFILGTRAKVVEFPERKFSSSVHENLFDLAWTLLVKSPRDCILKMRNNLRFWSKKKICKLPLCYTCL